ncbi:hypothetical protein LCGC14_0381660 [marine sediment metagenome]|uniref:Uncharacterized protein n=1 Tax=marine sediment metagenome TaxID=412755 RepID=A0A0F9T828_9ZZZZ
MSSENSFRESAEFFTERARRISSKVTALSRREDLSNEEKKELHETITLATVYGNLGVGYGLLAILDQMEVKDDSG